MFDRLCFGTSTFVAGKLRPDKDSNPGIETLREAVRRGLTQIHSNPRLGTQWAIREALEGQPARHLIKAEAPLDTDTKTKCGRLLAAIEASLENLGVDHLSAVVAELDIKRTQRHDLLVDESAVADFYSEAAAIIMESGLAEQTWAYCHSPAHLLTAASCSSISGLAAQYNLAEPWAGLYLDTLDRPFLGMAPLRRGELGLDGLAWALAHPAVTAVVVTMSTTTHLTEVITSAAAASSLDPARVRRTAQAWMGAS